MSPGTFDKLVQDGRMPKPKRVGARLIFDRFAVDLAFTALDEDCESKNDFDEDA